MCRPFVRAALLLATVPSLAAAQSPQEIRAAAALITPARVLQRIRVIADDSMGGRNTPSPGLEKTAQYLADNYRKWGLKPLGENGTWFQRYPLLLTRADQSTSYLELDGGGGVVQLQPGQWMYVTGNATAPITGTPVVVGGAVVAGDVPAMNLAGRIVLLIYDQGRAAEWALALRAIRAKGPAGIVEITNASPILFAQQYDNATNPRVTIADAAQTPAVPMMVVQDSLIQLSNAAGMLGAQTNWQQLRTWPNAIVADAPPNVRLTMVLKSKVPDTNTAPNVVALIEGSDPVLKHEYVVFSAHMDHIGTAGDGVGNCPEKNGDRICNGADDDGSGTTGVMSIAEAAASLKGKTRRSIIILNVSGEEKGLLGSAYFAAHPTVPIDSIVADINMDMIGRNNPDSIVVIGKEHSDMGTTLARVQAAHPELHLIAADDIWPEQSFYSRSDHFNFARKGVPILFFFNGTHPQYHQADDEVKLIDTSKLSRVAQLGFYLGIEIANTTVPPAWNPESRHIIVDEQKAPPVLAPRPGGH